MKKNLYFHVMYGRQNLLKLWALEFFLAISSPFRLILEVFIRKHMGERYFSFASVLTVGFLLLLAPFVGQGGLLMLYRLSGHGGHSDMLTDFLLKYTTWYLFVAAFIYYGNVRRKEIKRDPSVFDFGKFSFSGGHIHPFFYRLKLGERYFTNRQIQTLIEPVVFFIGGLLLYLIGQNVGIVFIVSSIIYSLSYFGAYYKGDNLSMDEIDKIILQQEKYRAYVLNETSDKTRGVYFFMRKPTSEEDREALSSCFIEGEDFVPVK